MDCYICSPACENCRPKYAICSSCNARVFLDLKRCPNCGHEITEEVREDAYLQWVMERSMQATGSTYPDCNMVRKTNRLQGGMA